VTLGAVADGRDPAADADQDGPGRTTVGQAFEEYLGARRELKPSSVAIYRSVFNRAMVDWFDRPLASITADAVLKRHAELSERSGPALANLAMRIAGAVFTFAMAKYVDEEGEPILLRNPVKALSTFRSWNRSERPQTVIKAHELPRWWQGVHALENRTAADYLAFVLLTGLRRREAAGLTWKEIDFSGRSLTIAASRTKKSKHHTLPLGPFVMAMLERRRAASTDARVFPPGRGDASTIQPTFFAEKVAAASGVKFTIHDLRRTFSTVAESLDTPAYALKRLLNHVDGDVTGGYLIINTERLRRPMEAIERYFLAEMGVVTATVTELGSSG
jgi:integrase